MRLAAQRGHERGHTARPGVCGGLKGGAGDAEAPGRRRGGARQTAGLGASSSHASWLRASVPRWRCASVVKQGACGRAAPPGGRDGGAAATPAGGMPGCAGGARGAAHKSARSSLTLLSTSMIFDPASSCITRPLVTIGEIPSSMHVPLFDAITTRTQ